MCIHGIRVHESIPIFTSCTYMYALGGGFAIGLYTARTLELSAYFTVTIDYSDVKQCSYLLMLCLSNSCICSVPLKSINIKTKK